jgi:hypothetical protein
VRGAGSSQCSDQPDAAVTAVSSGSGPVVVVQQDIRVSHQSLAFLLPLARGCLRHQEAPRSAHVDLDLAQDPAVLSLTVCSWTPPAA